MDAVMDLSARAVSFVTLIQTVFIRSVVVVEKEPDPFQELYPSASIEVAFSALFFEKFSDLLETARQNEKNYGLNHKFLTVREGKAEFTEKNKYEEENEDAANDIDARIEELVWISSKAPDEKDKALSEKYALKLCYNFVQWIINNREQIIYRTGPDAVFDPPAVWRDAITELVYNSKEQRIALAAALEYLPIHIVLALGGGINQAQEQRILQWWPPSDESKEKATIIAEPETSMISLLTDKELTIRRKFIEDTGKFFLRYEEGGDNVGETYESKVINFLSDWKTLKTWLLRREAPLSFEYVFNDELDEIAGSRDMRRQEQELSGNEPPFKAVPPGEDPAGIFYGHCNPFIRAKNMKLCALTLSGGGIRSATFNLGLLQGLAQGGVINKIDYLSTVSGGGYIGSWLATWIKREGSVKKVTDRLDTSKSPNPMGEEVRPVRWLRMFSNYFAPNKGIMTVDSWTVGVTWLRNTLLNQVVIFSILFAILIATRLLWELWLIKFWARPLGQLFVYSGSCLLLFCMSVLTGSGMQWYLGKQTRLPLRLHDNSKRIAMAILLIAFAGSFMISATLYGHILNTTFFEKIRLLKYAGGWMLVTLLFVAEYGKYHKCLLPYTNSLFMARGTIFLTALFAAALGLVSLSLAWKLFEMIKDMIDIRVIKPDALAFAIGPAVVLLVFGITVVARMAFLGKFFPDERREWWGRMGATINKWAFIWMLLAAATLVIHDTLGPFMKTLKAPASIGGWMALVGATVKAAFSGKTSGKEEKKGFQAIGLDLLSSAGPYIFIAGLLIFLPQLIDPLMKKSIFPGFLDLKVGYKLGILLGMFLVLGTYLSWKLGVNEFSMHHFYRNRLVRAYLGATRRNPSRQKTANPFTNFDKMDDEKLAAFTNNKGYYGPYPVLNTALNATQVADLSRQDRKAESFIFSPLYCGFDFSRVRSSANPRSKSYDYGMRPTEQYAYPGGPAIGTAMAISGAAVNPNQGYHSSAGTAFLLTVFNVQMGWWIGNPRKSNWKDSDPDFALGYIFSNLSGQSSTKQPFVCLSDGGHFDNMGLYEMVRRRCSFIVVSDAEQDDKFTCEGFANAIRCCRIDLGAEIDIDISDIIKRKDSLSAGHFAFGKIRFSGEATASGTLLYIKSSITGDEPVDITEYAANNQTFPHQTTADQFFNERQFESYRKLGMHIAQLITNAKKV